MKAHRKAGIGRKAAGIRRPIEWQLFQFGRSEASRQVIPNCAAELGAIAESHSTPLSSAAVIFTM